MGGSSPSASAELGRRLAALLVLAAAAALVIGGFQTSQAEVTASTSSVGLFSAGSVELEQVGEGVELLFDEDLLYPGMTADACVRIAYRGSVPAEVRVYSQSMGGTGLDQYIQFQVWTSSRPCPGDQPSAGMLFDQTLRDFWQRHGDYGSGVSLGEVEQDQAVTLLIRAELLDEADAAGRHTDFVVVVEARP